MVEVFVVEQYGDSIENRCVQVDRTSEKSVWIRGTKEKRDQGHRIYFDDQAEAIKFEATVLVEKKKNLASELDSIELRLEGLKSFLDSVTKNHSARAELQPLKKTDEKAE